MIINTTIPAAQNPTASQPWALFIAKLVTAWVAFERGVMMKTSNKTPGMLKVLPKINICHKCCHHMAFFSLNLRFYNYKLT
jgi:uncharacterized membrane protein YphA (DoxX/SURF4 family)